MDTDEIESLRHLHWMPSRIPVIDALAADVPPGAGVDFEIPASHEQRWYPKPDGTTTLYLPYSGAPFDARIFRLVPGGWDHTTCDVCTVVIPPMTLCYVTSKGGYVGLCAGCYSRFVVRNTSLMSRVLTRVKRLVRIRSGIQHK